MRTTNAATEIAREHNEIDTLAARIAILDAGPERAALVHEVSGRFLVHTEVEERYVNPVVRRLLPDGGCVAAAETRDNRTVARTIATVVLEEAAGCASDDLVSCLVAEVRGHVRRQDATLLPALVEACSVGESDRLGERVHDGIRFARAAAVRAGTRACEQAERGPEISVAVVDAEARERGFSALLRHMAAADGAAPCRAPSPSSC